MNVKEILLNWLLSNGYDGFYNDDLECGCHISDLIRCGACMAECIPGYMKVPPGEDWETNWTIVSKKP